MTEKDAEIRARVRAEIARQPGRARTHVLEVLHGVQAALHSVPRAAAEEIEREMGVPVADVYGLVTFYDLLSERPTGRSVLRICVDLTCDLHGAKQVALEAERRIGPEGEPTADGGVSWTRCACLGLCDKAPAALFEQGPLAPLGVEAVGRIGDGDV